jgi:hypothetical protein
LNAKAGELGGRMRLPVDIRLELLIAVACLGGILTLTGCGRVDAPVPAQQIAPARQVVGTGTDVSFRFLRWEKGLNLLLVDDIHQGNSEHETSPGSADHPARSHKGATSAADGRAYGWQLETTDGQTAKLSIERQEYDLSKGALLVVKTKGKAVQALQLKRDLAAVPFDVEGCSDYLRKDSEVMKFLEAEGVRIQESESGKNLFKVVAQEALVLEVYGRRSGVLDRTGGGRQEAGVWRTYDDGWANAGGFGSLPGSSRPQSAATGMFHLGPR